MAEKDGCLVGPFAFTDLLTRAKTGQAWPVFETSPKALIKAKRPMQHKGNIVTQVTFVNPS